MFPWVHGFHWDAGHLIFLGLFFSVVMVIFCTVTKACLTARKDFKSQKQDEILWEANFEDLPAAARICRHELTGEFQHRTCDNNFDCRRCATHAKLMAQPASAKTATRRQEEPDIFGLNMPLDRFYHRGHTWAKPETDGTITVGLDDLGARLIGKPDEIALPAVGTQVKANGTGWHVKKQRNSLRVLSPVDGEVIATGGPEKGWYLRVKPNGTDGNMNHLLRGAYFSIKPFCRSIFRNIKIVVHLQSQP
jgi:glycine cleavage system H lipoate-binding protein